MAKRIKNEEKSYSQAELIGVFNLERLTGNDSFPLMQTWMSATATLDIGEQMIFDKIRKESARKIDGWHEEDLKMKFISFVLMLGHLSGNETDKFNTYFERTVSATVEGVFLKTKTDFMVAKGILDLPSTPYFHFQAKAKKPSPFGGTGRGFTQTATLSGNS
jgi:hypothetical protein